MTKGSCYLCAVPKGREREGERGTAWGVHGGDTECECGYIHGGREDEEREFNF
jgi:hypothetical protein